MSVIEAIQIVTSTGVLAGGLGVLRWALSMERRVMKLELTWGTPRANEHRRARQTDNSANAK